MSTLHIIVKGKVQGVFYRASAKEKAEELTLTGWVKNTPDGAVEIMVSGKEEEVRQFIDWCLQGPPMARVSEVIDSKVNEAIFDSFTVIR
jgi:acylphosphatase